MYHIGGVLSKGQSIAKYFAMDKVWQIVCDGVMARGKSDVSNREVRVLCASSRQCVAKYFATQRVLLIYFLQNILQRMNA